MDRAGRERDPGLQVLGVVIGGLPMVINSVNTSKPHYQFSEEMVNKLEDLTDTLQRQHFLLRKDLESILHSQAGILGEEKVAEILHQPHAVYFAEPDVVMAVERSLGNGKDVYVSTVRKCGEAVLDIAERLAGFPSTAGKRTKGTGRGRSRGKRQLITSASQRRDFDRLLERLDYTTVLLARLRLAIEPQHEAGLAAGNERTASKTGSTRRNVNANAYPSLDLDGNADVLSWAAGQLYTAISAGFDTDCHATHTAALFLPSGMELRERGQEDTAKQPVAFTVGFRMPSIIKGYYTAEATVIPNRASHSQPIPGPSSGRVSNDLCRLVTTAEEQGRMLELHVSQAGTCTWNELHPALSPSPTPATADLTTLSTVIRHSAPGSWTTVQKLRLSLLLASSILQLSPTRWLLPSHPLTSETIWFSKANASTLTRASASASLFPPKPLILRDFFDGDPLPSERPVARNSLLEFTVLLLEIWHQRTFDWYAEEIQAPLDTDFWARSRIVEMWVEDSKDLVLDGVYTIMVRCVNGTFGTAATEPVARWDDDVFRAEFWRRVVVVLGEALDKV
ncbi:hypothetical protein BDW72DRAFT_200880 [Aspergillus terricola var. indicus]